MKEGWTTIRLGDIGKISSGKAIPSTEIEDKDGNGLHPCYGGNGLRGYTKEYIYDGAYPIIGRVGALCGNIHLASGKFYPTEHALVMSLKRKDLPHFIEYLLLSLHLNQYAKGVAQPVLSASTLSDLKVSVPSLPEQERIVAELDLLTGIIDKQKAQLKELDTLAQSIFYDMFGDPVENEKGWEVRRMVDVATGKLSYGSGSSSTSYDGNVRYIRITDIDDIGYLKDEVVSASDFDEKYLLNDGDILFARTGATVGKTYRHREANGKCIYAGYLIRLVPNKKIVHPDYVFGFTKTHYYKSFVALAQKAVAQPNINAEQYSNLIIYVPPIALQQSFASKIESIESQKSTINRSIAETQKLFDYTMDKYFG